MLDRYPPGAGKRDTGRDKPKKNKDMNEIINFMYYMCTNWSLEEANLLFGPLGPHIWDKSFNSSGGRRDSLEFFGSLDSKKQKAIVDRVHELYNK